MAFPATATTVTAAENITARGGRLFGNGGWVETSGKRILNLLGSVNASAIHGNAGTWLLDPINAEIVESIIIKELKVIWTKSVRAYSTYTNLDDAPSAML